MKPMTNDKPLSKIHLAEPIDISMFCWRVFSISISGILMTNFKAIASSLEERGF